MPIGAELGPRRHRLPRSSSDDLAFTRVAGVPTGPHTLNVDTGTVTAVGVQIPLHPFHRQQQIGARRQSQHLGDISTQFIHMAPRHLHPAGGFVLPQLTTQNVLQR